MIDATFEKPSRYSIQVFGPAYRDRILLTDRPLVDHELAKPLDQSIPGSWIPGEGILFVDSEGSKLEIEPPGGWPGPSGTFFLSSPLGEGGPGRYRVVAGKAWHDDLGGMGAGYAASLGCKLVSALGPATDPASLWISEALKGERISHQAIIIPEATADTTLLVSSGPFGDKLAFGFRGCHTQIQSLIEQIEPVELRVVAGLPNRLAAEVLKAPGAEIRFFAPAIRNMLERELPISKFAGAIDLLCCNRREWESLDDREQVAWQVSILAITDGAEGCLIRFTTEQGEPGRLQLPAFPRLNPPVDTNRAGETFGSKFAEALLKRGWRPGVGEMSTIREAAEYALAAAALQLDRVRFGFPQQAEIEAALKNGRISSTHA